MVSQGRADLGRSTGGPDGYNAKEQLHSLMSHVLDTSFYWWLMGLFSGVLADRGVSALRMFAYCTN